MEEVFEEELEEVLEVKPNTYPNIKQSFGLVGIVLVGNIIPLPLLYFLNPILGKEAAMLLYYSLAMLIPFLFLNYVRKKKTGTSTYSFSIKNPSIIPLIIVATLALLFGIITPIGVSIPMPDSLKEVFLKFGEQKGVYTFLLLVVAAPFFEELIFRGIVLDGLLKKYSPTKSILVSSALFGLIHLNPWQFVTAFILGVFMGWIYYKTTSLSLTMLIHATANLSGYLLRFILDPTMGLDQTLIGLYGGLTNLLLAICLSSILVWVCVCFLQKEFQEKVAV